MLTPGGSYCHRFAELGIRWVEAPMNRRSLNVLRELKFLYWLFDFFRTERPHLIHSFTLKCCLYASLVGKLFPQTRKVNTVAGLGYVFTSHEVKARLLRPLVRFLILFGFSGVRTSVVVLNKDDFSSFRKLGFSTKKLHLILGAGVSKLKYFPRQVRENASTFRVVLPARMLWDKGIREFVDASRLIQDAHPEIECLLAGAPDPGNPTAIEDGQLRVWERQGLVKWLGHVDQMADLYHDVDAVVLPSYREGLPTSLTEAAMCALPLIASDVPGCRDVIDHEVDGLLVPVRNAQALADAIVRLATDRAMCNRLGQAALLKALDQFEETRVIERTLAVYSAV